MPGIAETLDWGAALIGLKVTNLANDLARVHPTLVCLLKTEADQKAVTSEVTSRLAGQAA